MKYLITNNTGGVIRVPLHGGAAHIEAGCSIESDRKLSNLDHSYTVTEVVEQTTSVTKNSAKRESKQNG